MSIRFSLAAFVFAASLPSSTFGQEVNRDQGSPQNRPKLSVRDLLTEPILDANSEEGVVWARTLDQRARFDSQGLTILPAFGREAVQEWPVEVHVSSVTFGGASIDAAPLGQPLVDDTHVSLEHRSFTEVHHLRAEGTEQTFVFQDLRGEGDLVIDLSVETELTPVFQGNALRFMHPNLGHVECGQAFVLDAAGRRAPIERTWAGTAIQLTVPAAFLANATFPVTVDPLWSTFTQGVNFADDGYPDVVYAGASDRYVGVWEEFTSQQNSDIYMTWWDDTLGSQGPALPIEIGSDSWTRPAIGYSWLTDRVLVAARVGVGTNQCRVEARIVNAGTFTPATDIFRVSTIGGTQKESVDVGGSNAVGSLQSGFCVTWSRRFGATESNIEYRLVSADGGMNAGVVSIDPSAADDIDVQISEGLGDTVLQGDNWYIVWTRATDGHKGQIWAKRLYYNGSLALSSDPIVVDGTTNHARPAVSSLLDAATIVNGERAVLVVYEEYTADFTRPSGFRSSIVCKLIAGEQPTARRLVTEMEDFGQALLQERPQVGTNGRAVFITYMEEDPEHLNAGLWNACLATGEIAHLTVSDTLCLAERRVVMSGAPDVISTPKIAMEWEGDSVSTSRYGVSVWSRSLPNRPDGFGKVDGRGIYYAFPKDAPVGMVGRQYGDANPHSGGPLSSSWLRILGNGDRSSIHLAQARDLPPNVFGFLLVSKHAAYVNLPGGSQGRLLLGGTVGRYNGQIISSNNLGSADFVINPMAIPQGNGIVQSAIGDTWRFQVWHRDLVNGLATSNFTNGCAVTFTQ